jgi:hypothetical protein
MMSESEQYDDIATQLLFENEHVKIWELRLEPGASTGVHQHRLDHVLIQIAGDRVAVEPDPATQGPYDEYLEVDIERGAALLVEKGGIERAVNVGQQPYYEIIVELKQ